MAVYAKPKFSVQEVNLAGKRIVEALTLADDAFTAARGSYFDAFDVIDNYRASHTYPLNSFNMTLKTRATHIYHRGFTAQRIKRLESIAMKLIAQDDMKLSQMQDIGGCRAIMPTLDAMIALRRVYNDRPVTHSFLGEKNYISEPKNTSYRGIHLKYRFRGRGTSIPWDGKKIEIQLRTQLQHQWATAVEAAATFTKEALKSNRGRQEWLRFFALMSSVFALREGCPTVPGTAGDMASLQKEIRELNGAHRMQAVFAKYRALIPHIERQAHAGYFLVTLNPAKLEVTVKGFKKQESQAANKAYIQAETVLPKSTNVVLVSVSSIAALKRAYPNYFLDTADFLSEVAAITGEPMV